MAGPFGHPRRFAVVLPHNRFKPSPGLTESQIAYYEGRQARMDGSPERDNPYSGDKAAEWTRGYTDGRR
jgi:hypothetical protein